MADRSPMDEVVATGTAPVGSPTVIPALESRPASVRGSLSNTEDGEQEGGQESGNCRGTPSPEVVFVEGDEQHSPIPSTNFSEAPTLISRDSKYTANTGGRARQSWRGGIANRWRPSSFVTDDATVPASSQHNDMNAASSSSNSLAAEVSPVELSATPVTRPDEPRSYFDTDSESEEETVIRIASRASSLCGQRPKLVEHRPSNSSLRQARFYSSSHIAPVQNPGPSQSKAEQLLGTKLKNLLDLTPAAENTGPLAPGDGNRAAALDAITAKEVEKASTTALAPTPTPPSPPKSFDSSLVIEVPNTPARAEALDTLPSPWGGFGTLRKVRPVSSRISPLDALRSNPVSGIDTIGLQRAISAPPLPHRSNRRVTIRPVDMDVIHSADQKRLFRDSVVSTPYPTRRPSIPFMGDGQTPTSPTVKAISHPKEGSSTSQEVSRISPPEGLILELSLSKQPLVTKIITIPIYDRGVFDDRALFAVIRHNYNHVLLGNARRFLSARTLTNATLSFSSPSTSKAACPQAFQSAPVYVPFDAPDFVSHLLHAPSGHKRKAWLQWLRKLQPRTHSIAGNGDTGATSSSHRAQVNGQSHGSIFAPDGIRCTPAFVHPRTPPPTPAATAQTGSASSSPVSANAHPSLPPPATIPKVVLEHSFSTLRIAVAVALVVLLTMLATVAWVLFGFPGAKAGVGNAGAGSYGHDPGMAHVGWRTASQARVLTGLLLGLVVFFTGSLGVAAWVGGSWVAL